VYQTGKTLGPKYIAQSFWEPDSLQSGTRESVVSPNSREKKPHHRYLLYTGRAPNGMQIQCFMILTMDHALHANSSYEGGSAPSCLAPHHRQVGPGPWVSEVAECWKV
jgi:hypothetical protein